MSEFQPKGGSFNEDIFCYAKGTLILTKNGFVPIEKIHVGHQVITNIKYTNKFTQLEPVIWISKFKVKHLNSNSQPICITKHAFGNVPFTNLYVSPKHGILINGKLVESNKLVNGTTIYQDTWKDIEYYHLECKEHRILIANGVLAESYFNANNRHVFEKRKNLFEIRALLELQKKRLFEQRKYHFKKRFALI